MLNNDLTFKTPNGRFNYRVGAIIICDERILMAQNQSSPYYYSIGGRVRYGESSEEAVIREVFEETGCYLEIERLSFIHENFFIEQVTKEIFHELALYYYMKIPNNFNPLCSSISETGAAESLAWLELSQLGALEAYPTFFKNRVKSSPSELIHIVENSIFS